MSRYLLTFALLLVAGRAGAVLPDEQLADPKLESRARHISQELRCVVCQNQTIDDSDAPLAHDLRILLRQRLLRGDSDAAAEAFLVKRYGTYVLLQPPFETETLLLWLGPAGLLLAGSVGLAVYLSRRNMAALKVVPLSPNEERTATRLLGPSEA